jgi:branched-chain amino acid transport system ATP-binding protein
MVISRPQFEGEKPLLEIEDLYKNFGSLAACSDVSLTLKPGMILGLIGPNGAGKTTLLNLISGIYRPDHGQIRFMERMINGLRPDEINAAGIARTYQLVEIFSTLSVLENVMVGRHSKGHASFMSALLRLPSYSIEEKEIRDGALKCLDFVGLSAKASYPSTTLPLGERKLLELARALASEPSLLLVDEPAAGVSAFEKSQLSGYLRQIRDTGVGILLIEHDMKFVMELCTQIVVLNYGTKIAEGTPKEIRNNKEVISAYLGEE